MTKKEIKEQEEYLSRQSKILNESLDFWQYKTLEQVNWVDQIEKKSGAEESFFEDDEDFADPDLKEASQELDYCMMKLQWENMQLEKLDNNIKKFLKEKQK